MAAIKGEKKELNLNYVVAGIIGLILVVYYSYRGIVGIGPVYVHRGVLLFGGIFLMFFLNPLIKSRRPLSLALEAIPLIATVVASVYFIGFGDRIMDRLPWLTTTDIAMGVVVTVLVLESCRRVLGWPMTIIALVFILYGFLGQYLPGMLKHTGFSIEQIVNWVAISIEGGIWGLPMQVGSDTVIVFLIFAAFAEKAGLAELFNTLTYEWCLKMRGGAAKLTVVTSALMGLISGSATANVMVSGQFTIPLMKKQGFRAEQAAATEAVAACFGQFMPPVMGAAAFVMADFINVPYWTIAKNAFLPAILCYFSLYMMADAWAAKLKIVGLSGIEKPNYKRAILTRGPLLLSIVFLVYMIGALQWGTARSATLAAISIFALSWIASDTRMNPRRFFDACQSLAKSSLGVISSLAAAGIVIGLLGLTGLALNFSSLLLTIAGGNLHILLLLTMIAAIILGMGLPTTAAYIFLAIIVAPALIMAGIPILAAHMFVLYFAVLSVVTPPVAVATYAAAGLAEAKPMKSGWIGFWFALSSLLLPYIWVYHPFLLDLATPFEILTNSIRTAVVFAFIPSAIAGYLFGLLNWPKRILLFASAILMLGPFSTELLVTGIAIGAFVVSLQLVARQRAAIARRAASST